jgi:hypothetical protein
MLETWGLAYDIVVELLIDLLDIIEVCQSYYLMY